MENCIFCKIANKEMGELIYEDEYVVAFNDIHPVAPVHVIIIPKKHISNIMNVTEEDSNYIIHIHKAIREIAKMRNLEERGFRIITNYGEDGGQTVFHLHYHLIGGKHLGPKLVRE